MREDVREANVVMAKCKLSKSPFGIRIEKRTNNVWYCAWCGQSGKLQVAETFDLSGGGY